MELVIFQPINPKPQSLETITSAEMVNHWQLSGLAAINMANKSIKHMLKQSHGTLIFLARGYATYSEKENVHHEAMNTGIRILAESLAREFQPKGIHIIYCAMNVWSNQSPAIAKELIETCQHLHAQPRSTWTHALMV